MTSATTTTTTARASYEAMADRYTALCIAAVALVAGWTPTVLAAINGAFDEVLAKHGWTSDEYRAHELRMDD